MSSEKSSIDSTCDIDRSGSNNDIEILKQGPAIFTRSRIGSDDGAYICEKVLLTNCHAWAYFTGFFHSITLSKSALLTAKGRLAMILYIHGGRALGRVRPL